MITIRRSNERGHFDHGWLDTYHTFSFADYYEPRFMNEDRVAPGQGFGRHAHRDMEILTYVLSGELEHRDSLGNGAVIRPGEVQYMAAGTGVEHSEFNPSETEPVHFIQIWIQPARNGGAPRYEQRPFPTLSNAEAPTLLASRDGRDGSIRINQDAAVFAAALQTDRHVQHFIARGRAAWVQVLRGEVEVDGQRLDAGDGAAVTDQPGLRIAASQE